MAEKLTDQQLDELRQKHGRVARVDTTAGEFVFRAPNMAEENAFQAARFGTMGHVGIAWRNLMVTIVVYPEPPVFSQIMQQWPALNLNRAITSALQVLRGEVNEDEAK
jgi:hypothetical protein